MLTKRQLQCLDFIDREIRRTGGIAPSLDETAAELGLKSKSGAHRMIAQLEARGFLVRLGRRARAIEVLRRPDAPPAVTTDFAVLPSSKGALRAELHALEHLIDQRIEALDMIEAAEEAMSDAAEDPEAEPDPPETWHVPARSDYLFAGA